MAAATAGSHGDLGGAEGASGITDSAEETLVAFELGDEREDVDDAAEEEKDEMDDRLIVLER